jgi:hypothetical protein
MNESKPRLPEALEAPASDQLLDGILAKAANAGQRNAEQFAKLAARAKRCCSASKNLPAAPRPRPGSTQNFSKDCATGKS